MNPVFGSGRSTHRGRVPAGEGGQTLMTDAVRTAARVEANDLGVHR
ncbi:hypothetical protein [Ilumatobacter sp.]